MPTAMRIMVLRFVEMLAGEQIARADREHDQRGGQIDRGEHVREAGRGSSD